MPVSSASFRFIFLGVHYRSAPKTKMQSQRGCLQDQALMLNQVSVRQNGSRQRNPNPAPFFEINITIKTHRPISTKAASARPSRIGCLIFHAGYNCVLAYGCLTILSYTNAFKPVNREHCRHHPLENLTTQASLQDSSIKLPAKLSRILKLPEPNGK